MKKIGLLILFILLSACSVALIEEPDNSAIIESPIVEEIVLDEVQAIEDIPIEEEILIVEEPLLVIPEGATLIVTKQNLSDEIYQSIFGDDDWFVVQTFDYNQVQSASKVIIIYDELLLKEIPPLAFGFQTLEPMEVNVFANRDRTFTLINPGSKEYAENFIELLSLDDITQEGNRLIPYAPIIEQNYPFIIEYGRIGVLTNLASPGDSVPFLPRGTHTIFNNANDFFAEEFDTRVIFYPFQDDLGYPPSRLGKRIEPGDVEGFVDSNGVRYILIRERLERVLVEWFFLNYEVLGLTGKYNKDQIVSLFAYGGDLYRGTQINNRSRALNIPSNPFTGNLSNLNSVVSPIDVCRIEQINRPISDVYGANIMKNLGFPLEYNVPPKGEINIAIVAIDFPDVAGEEHYLPIYLSQVERLEEWSRFVSAGSMNYNVQIPDRWITAPREAKYYTLGDFGNTNLGRPIPTESQPFEESARQLILAADDYIDWSVVDFVQFIFPIDTHIYALDLGGPVINLQTPKAGAVNLWVWASVVENHRPDSPNINNRTLWDWVAHELLHYQGLPGHGPLNGAAYSIMMNQHGESKALLSWEAFLMGIFDENHIACIEPEIINEPIHLQLESLDQTGGEPGIKSLMIPVSEFEIVVVEYRTDGPFSTLAPEFHGFTAYYMNIDGEKFMCPWCDQLLIEQHDFKRYLRNTSEILECNTGHMQAPVCGMPSIVQYPGYHLDFFGVRLEFFNDGVLSIRKLY